MQRSVEKLAPTTYFPHSVGMRPLIANKVAFLQNAKNEGTLSLSTERAIPTGCRKFTHKRQILPIESYFKLMKSGGQQLEHWQQASGLAVLKRMLVASVACALVWSLQANGDAESEAFKLVLVRLSGKRLKRGSPPTADALLPGLFVWLQMIDFIAHIDADLTKIEQLKTKFNKLLPRMEKNV